jgi:hypothetical protein
MSRFACGGLSGSSTGSAWRLIEVLSSIESASSGAWIDVLLDATHHEVI